MVDVVKGGLREHGAFIPESPCDLPAGARVVLEIERMDQVRPPEVKSPGKRILQAVVERMQANPVPLNSPRFMRDELHERR